jgi:hypothetical protein
MRSRYTGECFYFILIRDIYIRELFGLASLSFFLKEIKNLKNALITEENGRRKIIIFVSILNSNVILAIIPLHVFLMYL